MTDEEQSRVTHALFYHDKAPTACLLLCLISLVLIPLTIVPAFVGWSLLIVGAVWWAVGASIT